MPRDRRPTSVRKLACREIGGLPSIACVASSSAPEKFRNIQLQMFLKGACEHGAKRIRVHIIIDGRDCLDGTSVDFVEMLENDLAKLREKGVDARIASGGGRMYVTMDLYENHFRR